MRKCVYCLKEIGDNYQECPFCGFPVSVPFTVKNVKQKWKQDMFAKQFKVEPSLDAIHRAEKLEQEGGAQQERAPQRTPHKTPNRPPQPPQRSNPQQPWGQAPQYPQYPQYPQNPGGYPPQGYPQQQGYGYPQAPAQLQYPGQQPPQYPQAQQYPQYPQAPQNPAQHQQWGEAPQQSAWSSPAKAEQKPPIPNHTAPPKQPTPARNYDAELFNDWLT